MGRARNHSPAIVTARFDAVLGLRRGGNHSLTANAGSSEYVTRLRADAAQGNLSDAYAALRNHSRQLAETPRHPVLLGLLDELAAGVAKEQQAAYSSRVHGNLLSVGVSTFALAPRVALWRRRPNAVLHLWPDGDKAPARLGPTSLGQQSTLCGRSITGRVWSRAPRGAWGDAFSQSGGPTACRVCARSPKANEIPDILECSRLRLHQPRATADADLARVNALREALLAGVQSRFTEAEMRLALAEAERESMLNEVAGACSREGGYAVQSVVGFASSLSLLDKGDAPQSLSADDYAEWAQKLEVEDWKSLLSSTLPADDAPDQVPALPVIMALEEAVVARLQALR